MNTNDVLLAPRLSEKSDLLRDSANQYVFDVHLKASKEDVKKAVEKVFKVKVAKIRTLIQIGKFKRRGAYMSKKPVGKCKKAVVSLDKDQTINLYDR